MSCCCTARRCQLTIYSVVLNRHLLRQTSFQTSCKVNDWQFRPSLWDSSEPRRVTFVVNSISYKSSIECRSSPTAFMLSSFHSARTIVLTKKSNSNPPRKSCRLTRNHVEAWSQRSREKLSRMLLWTWKQICDSLLVHSDVSVKPTDSEPANKSLTGLSLLCHRSVTGLCLQFWNQILVDVFQTWIF